MCHHHHYHYHYHHHHHYHHHKHQGLDPLIRSVSRVTTVLANVSSVFQLFFFLVLCSDMISKGFRLVAFFSIFSQLKPTWKCMWTSSAAHSYLDTRGKWGVSFTPQLLYPRGKNLDRNWLQTGLEVWENKKIIHPLQVWPLSLSSSAHGLGTTSTLLRPSYIPYQ